MSINGTHTHMRWQDALNGKNKNIRAAAAEKILETHPKPSDLSEDFDHQRALHLFNAKAERGATKEAMFVLLCLHSKKEYIDTLADYFTRKEFAPYGAPSVSDQSDQLFKQYLVAHNADPNNLFDISQHFSSDRIRAIFVELVSNHQPYIEKLENEFLDDSFNSSISMSNVKFLIESLGEHKFFDTVVRITTENLDTYQVGEKWFNIMQNGDRSLFGSEYVENQLLEICKSETEYMLQHSLRKRRDYFLYGAVTGLGINFSSDSNLMAIMDSLVKLRKYGYQLTFHRVALGDNFTISSKLMIDELAKKYSANDLKLLCNHFCSILSQASRPSKQYYSEEIKGLIAKVVPRSDDDEFEYFVKNSRSFYDLDELESLVKLVASARYGYGKDMKSDDLDDFIQHHLYECTYLLHAVKKFASDGSDIAQQWLTQDSINTKIDGMFDEEDYFALAALMKGLESDDSFDEMLNYIISKSSESIENKETTMESIISEKSYPGFGQFLLDELSAYGTNDRTFTKLVIGAAMKFTDDHSSDNDMSTLIVSEIVSILDGILETNEDLDTLRYGLSVMGSVGYGEPKERLVSHLLSIFERIPKDLKYNAAKCLNSLDKWNQRIEDTFLQAIDEDKDNPHFLYGHIHQIRNGGKDVSNNAMEKVLDLLVNNENYVVKMFAIDCLGFRTYDPSVPHIIDALRLGSQSEKEMKLDIRDVDGEITATFSVRPPQLAPFKIDDVYTAAIHALARLREYSIDDLLTSLWDEDENLAQGAFYVFELHQNAFKDTMFTESNLQRMNDLREKYGN